MSNTPPRELYWLQHNGSWFGFDEPAHFVPHKDGGYFASIASGEQIPTRIANGYRNPDAGIAPWASSSFEGGMTT